MAVRTFRTRPQGVHIFGCCPWDQDICNDLTKYVPIPRGEKFTRIYRRSHKRVRQQGKREILTSVESQD